MTPGIRTKAEHKRCESCGSISFPGGRSRAVATGFRAGGALRARRSRYPSRPRPAHLVRAFPRPPARRWNDRFPPSPARPWPPRAVGAGTDGDPGIGTDPSARTWPARPHPGSHPRRGSRRPPGALGHGGGAEMPRTRRRDRRALGRSRSAGLYRDQAAGGRGRTAWRACLAGPAGRNAESQRGADALADRQPPEPCQFAQPQGAGPFRLGRGTVPRPRISARALERHR